MQYPQGTKKRRQEAYWCRKVAATRAFCRNQFCVNYFSSYLLACDEKWNKNKIRKLLEKRNYSSTKMTGKLMADNAVQIRIGKLVSSTFWYTTQFWPQNVSLRRYCTYCHAQLCVNLPDLCNEKWLLTGMPQGSPYYFYLFRASDGRYERQGHEQLFIFSFIYTLTMLLLHLSRPCTSFCQKGGRVLAVHVCLHQRGRWCSSQTLFFNFQGKNK